MTVDLAASLSLARLTFRRPVPAALVALVVACGPLPATAGAQGERDPLLVTDVVRLVDAGVGEDLLAILAERQGFAGPLAVGDILELKALGLSDGFVAKLVAEDRSSRAATPDAPLDDGMSLAEEDGVLVVEAQARPQRGPPSDDVDRPPPSAGASSVAGAPSLPPVAWLTPAVVAPSEPVVVERVVERVVEVPVDRSTRPAGEGLATGNAFPAGATFGHGGSAVFLPAHFGDPPSHFGRTIVTTGAPFGHGSVHHGHAGHGGLVLTPAVGGGVVLGNGLSAGGNADGSGSVTIRTSRGTMRVPR